MRGQGIAIPFLFFFLLGLMIAATAADAAAPSPAAPIGPSHGRERVVVAVTALNEGTEVTDFLVPYGILSEAGAKAVAVAPKAVPVAFWPAGRIEPDMDFARFDAAYPEGADIVIVPAMHDPEDEAMRGWLRAQAAKGALMVSICEGARVLAGTGLLDGHRATGHFWEHESRADDFEAVRWQRNIRYVVDGDRISSAGVSASLPTSLMLAERIAGRERAKEIATHYGVADWGAEHNSDIFGVGMSEMVTALKNLFFGWPRTQILVAAQDGVSEVDLAFPLDFPARSWRSSAGIFAPGGKATTRHGLTLLADETGTPPEGARLVRLPGDAGEADLTLDDPATLREDMLAWIEGNFGAGTARFVAIQLEYPDAVEVR